MHCVCLEISTELRTLSLHNYRNRNPYTQIHIPHKTYICQTLSLIRPLVIFIILSQTPTLGVRLHYSKGHKAQRKQLIPQNTTIYTFRYSSFQCYQALQSIYNTNTHIPKPIQEKSLKNLASSSSCPNPNLTILQICPVPHPSILPKHQLESYSHEAS
jgi:hypothetical protein